MSSMEICRDQYETALDFISKGWDCSVQVQTIRNVMGRMKKRGFDVTAVEEMLESIKYTKELNS